MVERPRAWNVAAVVTAGKPQRKCGLSHGGLDFAEAIGESHEEDRLQGVIVRNATTKEELRISCGAFVNATGPMLSATHRTALASLSSAAHSVRKEFQLCMRKSSSTPENGNS